MAPTPLVNVQRIKTTDTGLSVGQLNAVIDATKAMFKSWILAGGMKGAQVNGQQVFGGATKFFEPELGIIYHQGPLLQADFTGIRGNQYWVRTARITNGDDDPPDGPTTPNPNDPPNDINGLAEHDICDIRVRTFESRVRWVQVQNVAESATRGHLLATDGTQEVVIFRAENARGITRWFMNVTPPEPFVWARVQASQNVAANKWRYTCKEQTMLQFGWADKSGGRTFTNVINGFETYNVADPSIRGNGVNSGGANYPAGFDLQPIRGNPVVQLWPKFIPAEVGPPPVPATIQWAFSNPNADDGTCD